MPDDYQYTVKPLPKPTQIGDNATSATQISADPPPNFPFGSDSQLQDPLNNAGGGGGGGEPYNCASTASIGQTNTNTIKLSCSDPGGATTGTITGQIIELLVGSDVFQITFNGTTKQLFITSSSGARSITLNPETLTDDGPDATFHELDVAHMGAPGKRVFLASDAYAA